MKTFSNILFMFPDYSYFCIMIIANPIYDTVFKRLMSNNRIARYFLSTILEETIEDLELQQQEIASEKRDNPVFMQIYRLDFVAVIKTADGTDKRVLIEIQKTRNYADILRFRDYLGEYYKKRDQHIIKGGTVEFALPIVTIYMLDYKLGITEPAVHVDRVYRNLITKEIINQKDDFAELLTHDSYIIQIPRIGGKLKTKIEELLDIFEQKNLTDDNKMTKEYEYSVDNPEINYILKELEVAGKDKQFRKRMIAEREYYSMLKHGIIAQTAEYEQKIEEQAKTIELQDKALEDKDKVLKEKDKALEENRKQMESIAKELAEIKRKLGNN